jgi:hypothetical protein
MNLLRRYRQRLPPAIAALAGKSCSSHPIAGRPMLLTVPEQDWIMVAW